MIDRMLRHLKTLALAAITVGSTACGMGSLFSGGDDVCISTLTVDASISGDTITTTVTPNVGDACTSSICSFKAASGSRVSVSYDTNGGQYQYLDAVNGKLVTINTIVPTSSGTSIDFAVAAASGNTVLFLQDPKITVKTGTCTGDDDDDDGG